MHIVAGIMYRGWMKMWKGHQRKMPKYKKPVRNEEKESKKEYKEKVEAAQKKWEDAKAPIIAMNQLLANWHLDGDDLNKIDRRYGAVQWPPGMTNNYLPGKDGSSFTSADWLHFVVYCGSWIMDDIITTDGNQYDMWRHFCRCVVLLTASSYTEQEAREAKIFTCRTVAMAEKLLPSCMHTCNWHQLIHLADAIIDKGPACGFWMFRFDRQWGSILFYTIPYHTIPS
jgi:hypothetical protein